MKIIPPSHEILDPIDRDAILQKLERAARTAYKSEDRIIPGSAERLIGSCIRRGHESVLEHVSLSVRFVCDRGVSHELVRHRLASYTQESTRYCCYAGDKFGGEITVIRPCFWAEGTKPYIDWEHACMEAEDWYRLLLLESKATPEQARSVLPNSLKTEVVMTANLREWRHILRLRTAPDVHPQMREIMLPLLAELTEQLPEVFGDIAHKDESWN